jgi:hypothetical protein
VETLSSLLEMLVLPCEPTDDDVADFATLIDLLSFVAIQPSDRVKLISRSATLRLYLKEFNTDKQRVVIREAGTIRTR